MISQGCMQGPNSDPATNHVANNMLSLVCKLNVRLQDVYVGAEVQYNVLAKVVSSVRNTPIRNVMRRGIISLAVHPVEYFANADRPPVIVYGQGHELHHADKVVFGNLFVHIHVLPHPDYIMDTIGFAHDLYRTVFVTLHDYFFGRTFVLDHPSGKGKTFSVCYTGCEQVVTMHGMGMRGMGALHVHFEMVLPKVPNERTQLLRSLVQSARLAMIE